MRKLRLDSFDAKEVGSSGSSAGKDRSSFRVFLILAAVATFASYLSIRDTQALKPSTAPRRIAVQKVVFSKPPESVPAPAPKAEVTLDLSTQMSLAVTSAAPEPAAEEETNNLPTTLLTPSEGEETSRFARLMSRRASRKSTFLFFNGIAQADQSVGLGRFAAGYGRLFRDDTALVRGSNGTTWEEPTVLYLKATFRF